MSPKQWHSSSMLEKLACSVLQGCSSSEPEEQLKGRLFAKAKTANNNSAATQNLAAVVLRAAHDGERGKPQSTNLFAPPE